jgi:mRNA-degrading endonuclease RelE of RelBE toxin-antitoxin system
MTFMLTFTDSALADLDYFKKYEQGIIVDTIDQHLLHEPAVETRNRKGPEPNPIAQWELRIGLYRVFYDLNLNEQMVTIKAIGWKEHNKLYIRGKEYVL